MGRAMNQGNGVRRVGGGKVVNSWQLTSHCPEAWPCLGVTEWPLPWAYNEPLFLMQLESFGLVLFCTPQSGAWSSALTQVGLSTLMPHPGIVSSAATFFLLFTFPCCNSSFHLVPGLHQTLHHKCFSRVQPQRTT